jgi:hypothetical protein
MSSFHGCLKSKNNSKFLADSLACAIKIMHDDPKISVDDWLPPVEADRFYRAVERRESYNTQILVGAHRLLPESVLTVAVRNHSGATHLRGC